MCRNAADLLVTMRQWDLTEAGAQHVVIAAHKRHGRSNLPQDIRGWGRLHCVCVWCFTGFSGLASAAQVGTVFIYVKLPAGGVMLGKIRCVSGRKIM